MKIYRLYYIDSEYVPSNVYDEDGYCDDYYDSWIDHDITLGYFTNKEAINKWIDEHCNERNKLDNIIINNNFICCVQDLKQEEIEVIE